MAHWFMVAEVLPPHYPSHCLAVLCMSLHEKRQPLCWPPSVPVSSRPCAAHLVGSSALNSHPRASAHPEGSVCNAFPVGRFGLLGLRPSHSSAPGVTRNFQVPIKCTKVQTQALTSLEQGAPSVCAGTTGRAPPAGCH